ncbi:MAG TPA: hypothetical protein VHR36_16280, partial [Pyrinomonadaceae bacterium]|nr:hypothetical protein [Pyrinomonadaceae bacterium]
PISTSYQNYEPMERGAMSLTPWLQPGDQVAKLFLEPFPTVSSASPANETVRNGSLLIPVCHHRAEAAVLIR